MAIALSFALALFQPMFPVKNSISRSLLAIFFISLTISNVSVMLIWNDYIEHAALTNALVPFLYVTALLIKGPLLNLYVRSITEDGFKIEKYNVIHILPVFVIMGILIAFDIDLNAMRYTTKFMSAHRVFAIETVWYSIKIIPLLYFISATVTVYRYRQRLKEHYSTINEPAIKWLYYLTLAFVLTDAWSLLISMITYLFRFPLGITDNYLSFMIVIALFYYSISFAQKLTTTKNESEDPAIDKPLDSIIKKIVDGIEVQKLHLNQNLNIEQFSKKIGVPYRVVSYAINKAFDTNFFEFNNSHRVEEAKRMLADKEFESLSIMEVLLESGFNSKSSFQRFFKRLTGVSPTEFRKNAMEVKA
jgi:AraC-like DNA-binding protein